MRLSFGFGAGRKGDTGYGVFLLVGARSGDDQAAATSFALHQVRNGMRVVEDRSQCQLPLPHDARLRVETILRLPEFRIPS